jgi:predicted DNA-binding transcriptional regulator AlpA
MSEVEELRRSVDDLSASVILMAQTLGTRLTREQMCERLKVHRNTLARMAQAPGFPQPDRTGKWLLSEVIEWETHR